MTNFVNPILCPISNLHVPMASSDATEIIAGSKKCFVSFSAFRSFLHDNGVPVPLIPQELHKRVFDFGKWVETYKISPNLQTIVAKRLFR